MSDGDLKLAHRQKDYFYPSIDLTTDGRNERAERAARRRAAQMEDAPRAMAEYRAAEGAVRLRTEKLRAARLARQEVINLDTNENCEGG